MPSQFLIFFWGYLLSAAAIAAPNLPNWIGEETTWMAIPEDTLVDLAERYNLGFEEIKLANPDVDPWLPKAGQTVLIPGRHLLPPTTRQGIVINLSDYRLYWFPRTGDEPLISYPIGIGTVEFPTPEIETRIVARLEQPAWYPPASIRARHLEEEGEPMDPVIPPGPDNPLGPFALKLEADGYLIHGTNKKMGIGMAVSHGCIRMYNTDIEALIHGVDVGVPVVIVREPIKTGVIGDELWAEYHPDEKIPFSEAAERLSDQIRRVSKDAEGWSIDNQAIRRLLREGRGVPVLIGRRAV